ncbi:Nucleoporin seh1 [Fasciola gigantica]|uniref:Nucleoporin seh1 n=1 Tax=Fasciola gigantica TaxID=46835 RepID=A0A504YEZ0_FASGI|nr:Nucleoporin seh1 [Fasciola gigantica]
MSYHFWLVVSRLQFVPFSAVMFVSRSIHTNHADLIHDVAYDFYGRRMATCSSDQTIKVSFFSLNLFVLSPTRIMLSDDVMNLSQWRVQFDFDTKMAGSCLAWSQSRLDPPLIAVGSATPSGSHSSAERPSDTLSSSTSVTTTSTGTTGAASNAPVLSAGTTTGGNVGGCATSSGISAAGGSSASLVNGKVVIYEYSEGRRHWDLVEDIRALEDAVYDVQFAPHMGQSFHTLAVASKEVYILRIRPCSASGAGLSTRGDTNAARTTATNTARSPYEISMMAHFDHHKGRVWRVSWNVTGSLLASSGDDGCVRLWQANYLGVWLPISVIAPDGSHSSALPQPGSKDVGAKAPLGSMMSQFPTGMRSSGNGLRLKMASQGDTEQGKAFTDRSSGAPSAPTTTPFQKLGAFAGINHPVAWH